jgi:hypothetical protein
VLHTHVVGQRDQRKVRAETMAGRTRLAVTEQVDHDDEVARRIQRPARADQVQAVSVGPAEMRRYQDGVVAGGVEPPVAEIDQARVGQDPAALQSDGSGMKDFGCRRG